jgi:hypothetical protein
MAMSPLSKTKFVWYEFDKAITGAQWGGRSEERGADPDHSALKAWDRFCRPSGADKTPKPLRACRLSSGAANKITRAAYPLLTRRPCDKA